MIKKGKIKVSIVILSWNQKEFTLACLKSVFASTLKNFEVILVDNGSIDGTVENVRVKFPLVSVIRNKENFGYAKANNQGVNKAKGSYIILLNNDTEVHKNAFSELVRFMDRYKDVGVAQAKLYWMSDKTRNDLVGTFITPTGLVYYFGYGKKDSKKYQKIRSIFFAKGAAMIVRKSVFDEVGYLDEDYVTYFEEYDFCWRVWLGGWKVAYVPKAVVYHYLNISGRKLKRPTTFYLSNRNRLMTLIKNLEISNLIWMLPLHLLIITASGVIYLFINPNMSLAILKAIIWNLSHPLILWKKRKTTNQIRKMSDKAVFQYNMVQPKLKYYFYLVKDMKDFTDITVPNYYE